MAEKKTVSQILIERFLKDVDEKESMPWQRPYKRYNAFNWSTGSPYRGINRIMLDFGEYLTANQLNQYNKEHNEDFRFQKGIQWLPVVFYKNEEREVGFDELCEVISSDVDPNREGYLGYSGAWAYYHLEDGRYIKKRSILRYSDVAERHYFINSKGEYLPSKVESGEVEITLSEPSKVIMDYIERSGVNVNDYYIGTPCYEPWRDTVCLNRHSVSEEAYFSTAFHELGHSTGAANRLNRAGITRNYKMGSEGYAVEECIAEICAYLCCAECGIHDFTTSGTMSYDNNIAYVQSWKKHIKDFDKEFIYICSQADKAFSMIMGMDI